MTGNAGLNTWSLVPRRDELQSPSALWMERVFLRNELAHHGFGEPPFMKSTAAMKADTFSRQQEYDEYRQGHSSAQRAK